MSDDSEDYVTINIDVRAAPVGKKAVQVRCADAVVRWIPRSCMFGPDETEIQNRVGELMSLRVFRWLAEKNGIPIARGK